jgi:hypothetical protein
MPEFQRISRILGPLVILAGMWPLWHGIRGVYWARTYQCESIGCFGNAGALMVGAVYIVAGSIAVVGGIAFVAWGWKRPRDKGPPDR